MHVDNPFLVSRAAKRTFLDALQQFSSSQTESPAFKRVSVEPSATDTIRIEVNKVHYVSQRWKRRFLSVIFELLTRHFSGPLGLFECLLLVTRHFSGPLGLFECLLFSLVTRHFSGLSGLFECHSSVSHVFWARFIFLGERPNCIKRVQWQGHLRHLGTGTPQGS
jgi:hypothetical protein